jgi:hypothetical protein
VRRGIELLDCISLFLSLGPRVVVALERNEDDEREQDRECRADHAEDGTGPVDVGVETTGGRARRRTRYMPAIRTLTVPTRTSAATGRVMLRFSPFAPAPTSCDDFADPSEQVVRFAAL